MVVAAHLTYGLAEYAEVEAGSELRFELKDGQLIAMAGGTIAHADLIAAVAAALRAQLDGTPCRVMTSDLRVGYDPTGFRAYPDIVVRCQPPETSPLPPRDTLLNPTMLVEVTSDRTDAYDRGEKLDAYKQFESLEVVILVSHRERWVQVHERKAEGWAATDSRAGRVASFGAGRIRFNLDEVYDAAGVAG